MPDKKNDIIAQLRKDILLLQGFKLPSPGFVNIELGSITNAFPNGCFPLGAVHEFLSAEAEDAAATNGFIACLISALMQGGGVAVWISSSRRLFPPALKAFGIEPDRIIFIDLQKERDILWVMEEALRCGGLAAVVGEIPEINFTASRRLQLAVEQSGVTGFILRHRSRNLNTNTCISRWRITSLPSALEDGMPGVGFPRWNVALLKIRNGMPGVWQMEWSSGCFHDIAPAVDSMPEEEKRKTG